MKSTAASAQGSAIAAKSTAGGTSRMFRKECRNNKCIHRNKNVTRTQLARKYNQMTFFSCQHCSSHVANIVNGRTQPTEDQKVTSLIYCSHHCLNQDWQLRHQYECPGRKDAMGRKIVDMLDPAEVRRIEKSTPLIRAGQLRAASQADPNEQALANMTLDELEFQKQLGKGSYGQVQLALHRPSGIQVAVKKLDKRMMKTEKQKELTRREIEIHKQLKHVNIVRMYTNLEDDQYIYLVMEYVKKSNLFVFIKKEGGFSEEIAFQFFTQTVSGIYFLHKNGFIHRDLKPENLLVNEDNLLKICDFGWTCDRQMEEDTDGHTYEEQRNTFCGTLEYMAPEMINRREHNQMLDVWALGILLYELVHGEAPYRGNQAAIARNQTRQGIKFKNKLSQEYKDLVNKLLMEVPEERIPLIKVFEHPWVAYFTKKLFPNWQPNDSDSEDDESSSGLEDDEDDDDAEYDSEEDDEDDDDSGDDDDQQELDQEHTPGPGIAIKSSRAHQAVDYIKPVGKATVYSIPSDIESEFRQSERPSDRKRLVMQQNKAAQNMNASTTNIKEPQRQQQMMQQQQKQQQMMLEEDSIADDTLDNLSIDHSISVLPGDVDVMADFGGFLEKRKKDKNMQRTTEMSQIDGLVTNLRSDLDKMMHTNRSKKQGGINRRFEKIERDEQLVNEFRHNADELENQLALDDLTEVDSIMQDSVRESNVEIDDTILQKRPSNNGGGQQSRMSQQRQSMNIFNKERKSTYNNNDFNSGVRPSEQGFDIDVRKSVRLNKENNSSQRQKKKRQAEEIDEAQRILQRKMRQMEVRDSARGTQQIHSDSDESDQESYDEQAEDDEAQELSFPKRRSTKNTGNRKNGDMYQTFGQENQIARGSRPSMSQQQQSQQRKSSKVSKHQQAQQNQNQKKKNSQREVQSSDEESGDSGQSSEEQAVVNKKQQNRNSKPNHHGRPSQKQQINSKRKSQHPDNSDDFEEVSEEDEEDSDSEAESDDESFVERITTQQTEKSNNLKPQQNKKGGYHQRLSSKAFDTQDDYNSDLDQSMQQKYKERQMAQQKKRKSHKYETAGKPKPAVEIDDEDGYEQPDNINSKPKRDSRTERKKGNTTFQRMKKRAEKDFSLRYDGGQRMNETNPHSYDHRDGRQSHFLKGRENQMSPHSRMMFQSEAQFLDNYGERPIGRFNGQSNQENTMWDKLSKIFTFGCIETSHNNKP